MGQRALVRGGNRNALGTVDGRAAANGNQAVAALGLVHVHRRAHGGLGGVRWRLVKDGHGHAGQGVQCFLQHTGGFYAGVRHDQRARDSDAFAFLLEQLDGAEFELDLGDVVDECHGATGCVKESASDYDSPPALRATNE
ncbi:hypothetical protein D3C72_1747190 [compost metagenome]